MSSPQLQDIRYARYEASHFAQLRELFKTVWGANRNVEYDVKHWNETLTGACPAIVGRYEERVVGFYMVWPMLLSDGREQVLGGQPIDSMVHPDFQGKGMLRELACRCYEFCSESKLAVMFGAPNRAAYAGNIGALNWCHVGNIVEVFATASANTIPQYALDRTRGRVDLRQRQFRLIGVHRPTRLSRRTKRPLRSAGSPQAKLASSSLGGVDGLPLSQRPRRRVLRHSFAGRTRPFGSGVVWFSQIGAGLESDTRRDDLPR